MARQVVINIDDDAWNECDIADELREVATAMRGHTELLNKKKR